MTPVRDFRLNRVLSSRLTAIFLKLPITPNQVTCASLALGATAGVLFADGRAAPAVAAAFAYELACVLDNCDGEIARAKRLGSVFGAWFDIAADFFTDAALFIGFGLGLLRQGAGAAAAWALGLCLFGASMHCLLVVAEKLRGFGPAAFGAPNPDLGKRGHFFFRIFDALREGEASWFVVAFALAGHAHDLLWFGAVYMQVLWLAAAAMNFRFILARK